ncbi:unnamed protein product [Paramecium octaurelia]|uniref:Uncharacterized protein n=1 Tax=Paramecium octaurelia TaxID=43137 RepID=A0A8S1V3H5_PAROT|nr:unnamed protein product [Paramecium octaurelia]
MIAAQFLDFAQHPKIISVLHRGPIPYITLIKINVILLQLRNQEQMKKVGILSRDLQRRIYVLSRH